jgi:hypothetical protein
MVLSTTGLLFEIKSDSDSLLSFFLKILIILICLY